MAELAEEVEEDDEDDEFFDSDVEGIPLGCEKIELHMLPLAPWIENEDVDEIISKTPGGVANIQDIYALAPRQEGILIHHLMSEGQDPYVLAALIIVDNETVLANYLEALQILVDRHDVLRTAVLTKNLPSPVQVVHRSATLDVQDLTGLAQPGSKSDLCGKTPRATSRVH